MAAFDSPTKDWKHVHVIAPQSRFLRPYCIRCGRALVYVLNDQGVVEIVRATPAPRWTAWSPRLVEVMLHG